MALATRISNAAAKAACNAIVDLIDVGGAGNIKIYGDTQATDPDTSTSGQTLLGTLGLVATAFGAAADANPGGRCTADTISPDTSADDTDTATWFRCTSGGGLAIIDGSVGTGTADMILGSVTITTGVQISITAWTVTVPEA